MARWSARQGRVFPRAWIRVVALVTVASLGTITCAPGALAMPVARKGGGPAVRMFGYARGPAQHNGTAAGKAHRVPASATRARAVEGRIRGHRAPTPHLAPPPVGTRERVLTGSARMARGHEVVGHRIIGAQRAVSKNPTASPPASPTKPSPSPSPSPSAPPSPSPSASPSQPSPSPGGTVRTASILVASGTGTDNATYSVAGTFDTAPMADQTGRIAVTLTNTGPARGAAAMRSGSLVFPAADTTGTGTPLTTGARRAVQHERRAGPGPRRWRA